MSKIQKKCLCSNCMRKTQIVCNWNTGDKICNECGLILEERMIIEDAPEYRIYSEENSNSSTQASKERVGKSQSIFESSIDCEFQTKTDEKLFYIKGQKMMDKFFCQHFPDSRCKSMEFRAKEIYDQVFQHQRREKVTSFTDITTTATQQKKRIKYSKKKTFVTAAIWIALMEMGPPNDKWSLQYISSFFGKPISEDRIKKSLNIINLDMTCIRKHAHKKSRHRRILRSQQQQRFLHRNPAHSKQ